MTVGVSGLCMACGVFIAVGPPHSGAHVPFEPAVTAPASSTPDGPHIPELPFNMRLPTAEYGGGTAVTVRLPDLGAAVDTLHVVRA